MLGELQQKIDYIEHNPHAPKWLKAAWDELKEKDIAEGMEEVELLADITMQRWIDAKNMQLSR